MVAFQVCLEKHRNELDRRECDDAINEFTGGTSSTVLSINDGAIQVGY